MIKYCTLINNLSNIEFLFRFIYSKMNKKHKVRFDRKSVESSVHVQVGNGNCMRHVTELNETNSNSVVAHVYNHI